MAALKIAWRERWHALWARWLPSTLFGRLALLLFVAVFVSHAVALSLIFGLDPPPPPPNWPRAEGAAAARLLEAPPIPPGALADAASGGDVLPRMALEPGRGRGFWPAVPLLDIGIRLAALMLAAWWGARWLSQPIHRLVRAAQELGADIHRPPLTEDGTTECREASRVFNLMQSRIRQQLAERDRFVAAVSHDLRTPLTRLRLRAENLEDEAERERFCRDINEMDAMIVATLDHLQGVAHAEAMVRLDIQSLLESLVDDEQAVGHDVTLMGAAAPLVAQASAMRRCIDNLVGNAVRYGGGAEVTLSDSDEVVRIAVRDHGPGVPAHELGKVLEPFYRVEGSRNRHSGGMGLGLAIARDIVQRHQGHMNLANAPDGGLIATVVLPRRPHQELGA